jgi:hypothetical protein
MDLNELADAVLAGDLLRARQWVADAKREGIQWESVAFPHGLERRSLVVAAALVELLAGRAGTSPPAWTADVSALDEPVVLDPGLESMRRSFAYAKEHGPAALRKRNLIALPDFLHVA